MTAQEKEVCELFLKLKNEQDVFDLLDDLLTSKELAHMVERWQIFKMLNRGLTQRQVAEELGAGVMTITRGAAWMRRKSKVLEGLLANG